jgi:hypothetical protein
MTDHISETAAAWHAAGSVCMVLLYARLYEDSFCKMLWLFVNLESDNLSNKMPNMVKYTHEYTSNVN